MASKCSSGHVIPPHTHEWRQLVYATSGAMTVSAGRWVWMIPPGNALLVPAGRVHSIHMWGEVAVRTLYFPASMEARSLAFDECRVLAVTALLREMILRVVEIGALDSRAPGHQHLLAALLDEMEAAPVTPATLPLPEDPRAAAVARRVLADPCGDHALEELVATIRSGAAHAGTHLPRGDGHELWIVEAESAPVRCGAPAGRRQVGYGHGAGYGLCQRERLHRGVQANLRLHAGSMVEGTVTREGAGFGCPARLYCPPPSFFSPGR